jgi:hypothetical protein
MITIELLNWWVLSSQAPNIIAVKIPVESIKIDIIAIWVLVKPKGVKRMLTKFPKAM